jgi:hypothetical protein
VPVRDYASFVRLLEGGIISIGTADKDRGTVVKRFQLTAGDTLSTGDLDDYLSCDAKYFRIFSPFMWPTSRFVQLNDITVAYETYVFQWTPEEWEANLESVCARRLPDERGRLKIPMSMASVLEKMEEAQDSNTTASTE